MPTLSEYYGHAKSSLFDIDPREMKEYQGDMMVAAVASAGVGLLSAVSGGLDKKIAGVPVPVDGIVAMGLGYAGLTTTGETGKMLKVASIAIGGSAAVRAFERFFAKSLGTKTTVKGEFEDIGYGSLPGYGGQWGPAVAFGKGAQDRLVEAAKYL